MHPEVSRVLGLAREARRAGASTAVLAHLDHALALARREGDLAGQQVAGWRRAKAIYDHGEAEALPDALDPLLALDDLFSHYPQGLSAAQPITRRIWDHLGYGDERVLRLWEAYSAHHRRLGDPWLASQGDVQRAWHLACRGELAQVVAVSEHYQGLSPARFGRGPTKHPEAEDTTLSLFWVQADLARVALRAATWAGEARAATDAEELLLDALATAGRPMEKDPWVVDALCRAADRFERVTAPWRAWKTHLSRWETDHVALAALGQGVLHRRAGDGAAAVRDFERAASLAQAHHAGFEWVADALQQAQRVDPSPERDARLRALRTRTGVGHAV